MDRVVSTWYILSMKTRYNMVGKMSDHYRTIIIVRTIKKTKMWFSPENQQHQILILPLLLNFFNIKCVFYVECLENSIMFYIILGLHSLINLLHLPTLFKIYFENILKGWKANCIYKCTQTKDKYIYLYCLHMIKFYGKYYERMILTTQ